MIFIGGVNIGGKPRGGEEAKNQRLVSYLKTKGYHIDILDTSNWRENKIKTILRLLTIILVKKQNKILISCATPSAYKLLRLFNLLNYNKKELFYIVIGGTLSEKVKSKKYNIEPYKKVKAIFVETKTMKNELVDFGLKNVEYLPNFRLIPSFERKKKVEQKIKFVFISRIIPAKGCDLILESVKTLNDKNLQNTFTVSFYGPIEESYQSEFSQKIKTLSNVTYEGYLNLSKIEGYEVLSSYDTLLFPTFHEGEGFPGILIDAFIAGVPIIASDWNFNKEILGEESIIIKPKNVEDLVIAMQDIIDGGKEMISKMAIKSKARVTEFDQNIVLKKLEENLLID